jgi:hypothetical protein
MATGPDLTMQLRRARVDEAAVLSAIAWQAKRH